MISSPHQSHTLVGRFLCGARFRFQKGQKSVSIRLRTSTLSTLFGTVWTTILTNFPCPCSCYTSEQAASRVHPLESPYHVIWCEDEEIQASRVDLDHLLRGDLSLKSLLTQPHALPSFLSLVASI